MLTVSVHGIALHANVGLYPQEKITGNDFEIDVDVKVPISETGTFPFIDYSIINEVVLHEFEKAGELLEQFVLSIHTALKMKFPEAGWVRVAVRKLHPPMQGKVKYSQVVFEK